MALTGLLAPSLKLILFGGKGGVGKTTCAASVGLYLAKSGLNTVLISTDPAHSLSDSLGRKIGDMPASVEGVERLSAVEINAEKALLDFKARYHDELRAGLSTSTFLDEEDIEYLLELPIPGIDEVMGFSTIMDLIAEEKFDKYIVDTAPTGHALRLITLPGLLDDWIKAMAKMKWKHRYMVTRFSGEYRPDSFDELMVDMKKTVNRIEGLLKDQSRCEFIAVTIPEDMAVRETERLMKSLRGYGIKSRQVIINNVIPSGTGCSFCNSRRQNQEGYIKAIKEKFAEAGITVIPLQPHEIKGVEALTAVEKWIFG